MKIQLYNGELFQKDKKRYLIFFIIFFIALLSAIFSNNLFGAVLLIIFTSGYFYFEQKNKEIVNAEIFEDHLQIGQEKYNYSDLIGFSLEIDKKTKLGKNIVLLTKNGAKIYTFVELGTDTTNFISELSKYLKFYPDFHQSFLERLNRILKL